MQASDSQTLTFGTLPPNRKERNPLSKNNDLDWTLIRSIAKDAGRKVARNYPGIDADDIEQTIYAKVLERKATFIRMNYTTPALFSIFTKYGTEYANNERLSALNFSDQYHYTVKEIRTLCGEALFDREAFMARIEAQDERITADPEETLARVIDLQNAYEKASDSDKDVLHRRFVLGESPKNSGESMALSRAIDRLALSINIGRSLRRQAHDGPGSRKAIRNTTAQAITSNQEG